MCADIVEIPIKKTLGTLRTGYDYSSYGMYQRPSLQNGIIYRRRDRPKIIVSKVLFNRNMEVLERVEAHTRTYSVPDTVSNILRNAFEYNNALWTVKLNRRMKEFDANLLANSSVQMIIYTTQLRLKNMEEFLSSGSKAKTVVLPSGVQLKAKGQYLNYRWYWQATMVVPPDLRVLNYHPIYSAVGLNEVRVLPGSRLEMVGDGTFAGTEIREFVAPPSLREVGHAAFLNCKNLTYVNFGQATKIGDVCLWGTSVRQTQANIWKSASYKAACQTPDKLVLPEGLRTVGRHWLYGSKVQELFIPQSVEEIEDGAFADCWELRKITFAEGSKLTKIGREAFAFTNISEFEAPPLLESIGTNAFKGSHLSKFIAPRQLKTIGNNAFQDCMYLK